MMRISRLTAWLKGRSLDLEQPLPPTRLWEGEQLPNGWANHSSGRPLTVSLNDDLTNWLWQAAFSGCHLTGDWDLLNACAGIAHAIRTEGIPLSAGLRASAVPARSGGTDFGSE
jgi:hypothetical protein